MRIELKDENQEEPQKIDENDIRYKHETDLTKKEKRELEKMKLASMSCPRPLQYIWAYYKPQMAAIVAVIAMYSGVWQWNAWYDAMLYITSHKLKP